MTEDQKTDFIRAVLFELTGQLGRSLPAAGGTRLRVRLKEVQVAQHDEQAVRAIVCVRTSQGGTFGYAMDLPYELAHRPDGIEEYVRLGLWDLVVNNMAAGEAAAQETP